MLTVLFTIVHVAVCVVLIMVVLLQTGKRADLAGAFGGGGSQTAFGARGAATFLSRVTTWSAVLFMVTSMTLAILASRGSGGSSVLETLPASSQSAPALPPGSQAPAPAPSGAPEPSSQTPPPAGTSGSAPQNPGNPGQPSEPAGEAPK
jgi:preprotein translocase subunit SecG